ncbi:MAG: ATP-binding protein, partial [Chloroflexi bacterium]|nr:ATP-binding protein [Chloroflexota bacterium]
AALAPVSRRVRDGHLAAARRGLDDFRRFAAVGRGTRPFIEVAERWQGILERQAAQLQAIPNPFVAGPPLPAGSPLFVGREDILKQIANHLAAGRGTVAEAVPKPALVLYGQRRMGKSSILLQLPVRLPEDYIPAYADLHELAPQDTVRLMRGLARVMADAVAARGLTPPAVAPLEVFALEAFATFKEFLDQVEMVIGTRRVALLLDEFERLQDKVDEGSISRDIFSYLASVIKRRAKFFLVFAGLHSLEQMRQEYWTPFLSGNSVGIPVSYLSQAEAERLLAMLSIETPPQVRRRICLATGCQPYLLQVVCYRLVEYLNAKEPPPEQASVRDVTTVLDIILEKGEADYYFEDYVWRYSTPAEREALVALAKPDRQGGPPLQEGALRSLENREILTQRHGGTWRYRVELVRRWVARKAQKVTTMEV